MATLFIRAILSHPTLVAGVKRLTDGRRKGILSKNVKFQNILASSFICPVVCAASKSDCGEIMTRKFFVGGNWKMNGSKKDIEELTAMLCTSKVDPEVEIVVAPPTIYLDYTKKLLPQCVSLAGQNCFTLPKGAFTGEVSPAMLKDVGVNWVIIGHSERRHIFGETDKLLVNKVKHAQCEGLKVIFCIGETLEERECGKTDEVVFGQLECVIGGVIDWSRIIIAYEPVWAIGTGKTATPDEAQEMHSKVRGFIRENVSDNTGDIVRIIYGGSVTGENSCCLAAMKDIDGFLVGGASLKPDFIKIINSKTVEAQADAEGKDK